MSNATQIKIREVSNMDDLHARYKSQTNDQPCYIELDCKRGELLATYDAEIGGGVPFSVWHGHDQRFPIPCLTADAANELMEEIKPLAEIVVAGYSSEWDGSNNIAKFTDEARDAIDEIREMCERTNGEQVAAWTADEWLGSLSARELGIDADTTDEKLDELTETYESELESNQIVDGIREYLESRREALRNERAE